MHCQRSQRNRCNSRLRPKGSRSCNPPRNWTHSITSEASDIRTELGDIEPNELDLSSYYIVAISTAILDGLGESALSIEGRTDEKLTRLRETQARQQAKIDWSKID